MTGYRYPPGAIEELSFIQAAINAVKQGSEISLYSVVVDRESSVIDNLVPFIPLEIKQVGLQEDYSLIFREKRRNKEGDLSLDWRGIPMNNNPGGHLFSNYWHAYAYNLR